MHRSGARLTLKDESRLEDRQEQQSQDSCRHDPPGDGMHPEGAAEVEAPFEEEDAGHCPYDDPCQGADAIEVAASKAEEGSSGAAEKD